MKLKVSDLHCGLSSGTPYNTCKISVLRQEVDGNCDLMSHYAARI